MAKCKQLQLVPASAEPSIACIRCRLKMDSGVVTHKGSGIVTIAPARRADEKPGFPLHPASEALTDGEHPGPLRRRQVLPDGPGHALARRRVLPSLLLDVGHQGR